MIDIKEYLHIKNVEYMEKRFKELNSLSSVDNLVELLPGDKNRLKSNIDILIEGEYKNEDIMKFIESIYYPWLDEYRYEYFQQMRNKIFNWINEQRRIK